MTTDWNNAAEANAALDRGELPDGYRVDADGTLHLPLGVGVQAMRGSSVIMARFARIVNVNGDVLKDKDGDRL